MNRYEALSRLLDGELPDEEAAEWRARIATDPEVAAVWNALKAMVDQLEAMPSDEPVPESLVQRTAGAPHRRGWMPSFQALALAAMALLTLWNAWPTPPTELKMTRGEQLVAGHVHLVAGGLPIHVDGKATIRVEPVRPGQRVYDQEVLMRQGLAGFAGGVLVTVAVGAGTVQITGHDGSPIELSEGETRTLSGTAPGPARPAPARASSSRAAAGPGPEATARLEALEQKLGELTLERDFLRGQLTAVEGVESPWPDNLTPRLRGDQFEETIRAVLGDTKATIVDIDCSEYPCLAVFQTRSEGEPGPAAAQEVLSDLHDRIMEEFELGTIGMTAVATSSGDDAEGTVDVMVGLALGEPGIEDGSARTGSRLRALMPMPASP
ncbi:MAG: hypothetical protein AAGA48_19515 [Myxococcota bacterium]